MVETSRRKHERHHFRAPITHSMYNRINHTQKEIHGYFDNYHKGITENISQKGISFESETPCRVMSTIHVNMPDKVFGLHVSKKTQTARARVMWCEKKNNCQPPRYRVGIKLLD